MSQSSVTRIARDRLVEQPFRSVEDGPGRVVHVLLRPQEQFVGPEIVERFCAGAPQFSCMDVQTNSANDGVGKTFLNFEEI